MLADLIDKTIKAPVTVKTILTATCEIFDFTLEQITGGSRRRPLVDARQIAMYVTRNMTDLSYPEIGRASATATTPPSSMRCARSSTT